MDIQCICGFKISRGGGKTKKTPWKGDSEIKVEKP